MVNYPKNVKFYKIYSNQEPDLVYIGSTSKEYLKQRFWDHKSFNNKIKKCASSIILSKYDDAKIELIEEVLCNDKDERNLIEHSHIKSNTCVNIKDTIFDEKEYFSKYYIKHKEHYKKQKAAHYIMNKEIIDKKNKEAYELNKETIRAQKREPIICECGIKTDRGHISRHRKTIKHIKSLEQLKNESI
jgi:hypothetical protein